MGLEVTQGHQQRHHLIDCIRLPVSHPRCMYVYLVPFLRHNAIFASKVAKSSHPMSLLSLTLEQPTINTDELLHSMAQNAYLIKPLILQSAVSKLVTNAAT